METWFRQPMVVRLITRSAYWVTASPFGLLTIRNLIHWWQTRAHIAWLAAEVSGRQPQMTTSHEHHTPGETPNNQPDHPGRATSRNRSETPEKAWRPSCAADEDRFDPMLVALWAIG
jgi:hypothetical protein